MRERERERGKRRTLDPQLSGQHVDASTTVNEVGIEQRLLGIDHGQQQYDEEWQSNHVD